MYRQYGLQKSLCNEPKASHLTRLGLKPIILKWNLESLDDVDNVPLCSLTDFKSTPIFICALSACYRIFPDRGRLETHRLKDHNIDSNTLLWQEVITWDAVRDEEMRKDATVLQATLSVPKSPIPLAGVESSLQSHSDFRKPRFEGLGLSEMVNNAMVIDLSSEEDDDEDSLAVAVEHNEMEITPDINIPGDDESRYLYDVNADPPVSAHMASKPGS